MIGTGEGGEERHERRHRLFSFGSRLSGELVAGGMFVDASEVAIETPVKGVLSAIFTSSDMVAGANSSGHTESRAT